MWNSHTLSWGTPEIVLLIAVLRGLKEHKLLRSLIAMWVVSGSKPTPTFKSAALITSVLVGVGWVTIIANRPQFGEIVWGIRYFTLYVADPSSIPGPI